VLIPRRNLDGSVVLDAVTTKKKARKGIRVRRDVVRSSDEEKLNTEEGADEVIEITTETRLVDG